MGSKGRRRNTVGTRREVRASGWMKEDKRVAHVQVIKRKVGGEKLEKGFTKRGCEEVACFILRAPSVIERMRPV